MRFAKVIYRVPGVQQHAARELPNPLKVNMQPTYVEITYDNQQQLLLPAANVVSVETFERDEDVNSEQKSQGEKTPAASKKSASKKGS